MSTEDYNAGYEDGIEEGKRENQYQISDLENELIKKERVLEDNISEYDRLLEKYEELETINNSLINDCSTIMDNLKTLIINNKNLINEKNGTILLLRKDNEKLSRSIKEYTDKRN